MATALALLLVTGTESFGRKKVDPQVEAAVINAVKTGTFGVEMTRARTSDGAFSNATGYRIKVVDGKISGRLPYYGRGNMTSAYGVEGDNAIVFDESPIEMKIDDSKASKGRYLLSFEAKSGSSNCKVRITIWTNRNVKVTCFPYDRSQMDYDGFLTNPY